MTSIRSIRKRTLARMGAEIQLRKLVGPCIWFPSADAAVAFLRDGMCHATDQIMQAISEAQRNAALRGAGYQGGLWVGADSICSPETAQGHHR